MSSNRRRADDDPGMINTLPKKQWTTKDRAVIVVVTTLGGLALSYLSLIGPAVFGLTLVAGGWRGLFAITLLFAIVSAFVGPLILIRRLVLRKKDA